MSCKLGGHWTGISGRYTVDVSVDGKDRRYRETSTVTGGLKQCGEWGWGVSRGFSQGGAVSTRINFPWHQAKTLGFYEQTES